MRVLFKLLASLALAAAFYHLIGLFHPVNGSPPWRHAVFVAIDLISAYGFLHRPEWFVWFFGALTVQQWSSHGATFLDQLAENRIPWMDLAVVLFTTTALTCLVIDRRKSAA